jgi:hypothetical protein
LTARRHRFLATACRALVGPSASSAARLLAKVFFAAGFFGANFFAGVILAAPFRTAFFVMLLRAGFAAAFFADFRLPADFLAVFSLNGAAIPATLGALKTLRSGRPGKGVEGSLEKSMARSLLIFISGAKSESKRPDDSSIGRKCARAFSDSGRALAAGIGAPSTSTGITRIFWPRAASASRRAGSLGSA